VRGASRGATGSTLAGGAAEHAPRVAAAGKGRRWDEEESRIWWSLNGKSTNCKLTYPLQLYMPSIFLVRGTFHYNMLI
jgi:hypothetical protein